MASKEYSFTKGGKWILEVSIEIVCNSFRNDHQLTYVEQASHW
ncbi:17395_t:CDS:1, partial [Rhizophagus irregularis]